MPRSIILRLYPALRRTLQLHREQRRPVRADIVDLNQCQGSGVGTGIELILSAFDPQGKPIENRVWAGDLMTKRFNASTVVPVCRRVAVGGTRSNHRKSDAGILSGTSAEPSATGIGARLSDETVIAG
jgi:hypothetical protein